MTKKEYYGYSTKEAVPKLSMKEKYGFDGWDILKTSFGLVASGCASVVLHRYLKGAIPSDASTAEKIVSGLGIYFVSGMVGKKVEGYVCQELEDLRQTVRTANEAIAKSKEEQDA